MEVTDMARSETKAAAATEDLQVSGPEKTGEAAGELEASRETMAPDVPAGSPRFQVTYPFGLNLRAGPGKGYPVLSVLPAGAEVQAAGERVTPSGGGAWLPVETCQGSGWVDAAYLRLATDC